MISNKKTKVLFISPKSYPLFNKKVKSTFGGSEVQLYFLGREVSNNSQFKVNFIVSDYGQKKEESFEDIKLRKSFKNKDSNLLKSIKLITNVAKIKPNVVILRSLNPFLGILAVFLRFKKIKLIYMVAHDNETDKTHKDYNGFVKKRLIRMLFKNASIIISQNGYQKEMLRKQNITSKIIKSGYPIKTKFEDEKKNILWVGRSDKWKQPKLFLDLAKKFPKEKFIMICPPSTYSPELSEQIELLVMNIKNLVFIKFVPFEEIHSYFANAKAYVNTSEQEGFPNTFIQAAMNKTPIISLNVNPDNFLDKNESNL